MSALPRMATLPGLSLIEVSTAVSIHSKCCDVLRKLVIHLATLIAATSFTCPNLRSIIRAVIPTTHYDIVSGASEINKDIC